MSDLSDLIERLRGYNTPDRTIDAQRQMSVDIHEAANKIKRLMADVDFRERERIAIAKIRDEKHTNLKAELKQANAALLTAQNERAWLWDRLDRLEKNDHWKTKLRVAMAEALAKLETDDDF